METLSPGVSFGASSNLSRQSRSRARRSVRWTRRAALARLGDWEAARSANGWKDVAWARTAKCGRTVVGKDGVEVHVRHGDDGPNAYFVGVSTCGSVWSCPTCSAKIRTRRALETRIAALSHVNGGGRLVMVTLTIRHDRTHALRTLLDVEAEAYRSLQQDPRWRAMRGELVGQIRAWEITQGLWRRNGGSGWHPHFHLLLFVKAGSSLQVDDLGWIEGAWAERVHGRLGARPDSHGFHAKELDAGAAEYVAKIADETARADLKGGSQSVWHIVDAFANGETWGVRAWAEYYAATKGLRAVQWSRGLRAHFGLGIEKSNEELAAAPDVGGELVETIDVREYGRLIRCGFRGAPAALARLELWEARFRAAGGNACAPPPVKPLELFPSP